MPIYNQLPIRLEADLVSNPPVTPIDANTSLPVQFWRAQGIALQIGIFDAYGNAVDLSNLSYLQLIVQEAPDSLVPSLVKQVNAGDIIPVVTRADWLAGINQQATFLLSSADTDLSLGGATQAPYWLQLVGQTTGAGPIVYAAGYITVFNPGLPAQPPTSLVSGHEQANSSGTMIVAPLSQIHHEELPISGGAGTRDCIVQATGMSKGALAVLRFQLPATAGINIRVFDQATSGTLLTTISSAADGFTPAARVALWFDGANWQRDELTIPAFGQQA